MCRFRWAAPLIWVGSLICGASALVAPVASAQSTWHCDDLAATVQSGLAVELSPSCTDPAPAPGTTTVYFVKDQPPVGSVSNVSGLSYIAPVDYVGVVSFTFYAGAVVTGTQTVTKFSNVAQATVNVVAPPPPPPRPDRDGDGVPDDFDECPDDARATPATGWTWPRYSGCLPPVAPFTRAAAKPSQLAAIRALVRRWRDSDVRARAIRRSRINVPFDVPARTAGSGRVQARLIIQTTNQPDGPRPSSVSGVAWCTPGRRCVMHAKLEPVGVRAYARDSLLMWVSYAVYAKHRLETGRSRPIRMPLASGRATG
jgi:hypothetical protein